MLDVIHLLRRRGAKVTFGDPYIPLIHVEGEILPSTDARDAVTQADATVIVTDHTQMDYELIVQPAALVVDTRNALRGFADKNIVRL